MGTIISFKCGCCGKKKEGMPNEVFLLDKRNRYITSDQKATKALIGEELICADCAPKIKETDLRLITRAIKDMWPAVYKINKIFDDNDGKHFSSYRCRICRQRLIDNEDEVFRVVKNEEYGSVQVDIFYALTQFPDAQDVCEKCEELLSTALLSTKSLTQIRNEAFGITVAPLEEKLRLADERLAKKQEEKDREKAERKKGREKANNRYASLVNKSCVVSGKS